MIVSGLWVGFQREPGHIQAHTRTHICTPLILHISFVFVWKTFPDPSPRLNEVPLSCIPLESNILL
jgi:hypothetical protein